jgi:putative chitobiose transport system permease protein
MRRLLPKVVQLMLLILLALLVLTPLLWLVSTSLERPR